MHLVLKLSGLREAASNPLFCRHRLPLSSRIFAMAESDARAAVRTEPPSFTYFCLVRKKKSPMMLINKTTSFVVSREVFAEVSTQMPEAEDHFLAD